MARQLNHPAWVLRRASFDPDFERYYVSRYGKPPALVKKHGEYYNRMIDEQRAWMAGRDYERSLQPAPPEPKKSVLSRLKSFLSRK